MGERWLRLIIIGLILAALAVSYLIITGGFSRKISQNTPQTAGQEQSLSPTPSPTTTPKTAYNTLSQRAQSGVETLPKTGFADIALLLLSSGAIISGWGLRRFPH